ncbi:MAG: thiamine pyrophosphate-binding protein [Sphingomonadales bacterium]
MPITVSEYIFSRLADHGVTDVFMISGGGIMHLCEALGRNSRLRYWCNYNEQATAIAGEAYAKVREAMSVCLVTTGPGSTNALSGVAGAWVDSIPMLVISGQVRTAIMADYATQRQVGPQEINILPMVQPVTKYAVTLMDAADTRFELERCLHIAAEGRPGPVWLNIPLDIQGAMVDPDGLRPFVPDDAPVPTASERAMEEVLALLQASRRPLIIAGNGVVLSGARSSLRGLIETSNLPVVTSISGMDLLPEDAPQFIGRMGPGGQRRANIALENSDLLIAIGTSLSISCVGFSELVARRAKKVLVNIDPGDLDKDNIKIDLPICSDAKSFLDQLDLRLREARYSAPAPWTEACRDWKSRYSTKIPPALVQSDCVDLYNFYDHLSAAMSPSDIFVLGTTGDACYVGFQHHHLKDGQRMFTSVCYGAMGWDLPALTGASIAGGSRRSVLVTGDGSVLFNVHELMFVGMHRLNAKIFVCNNDGYQSIRSTQDRYFSGHYVGTDSSSGVANPDFGALAKAFGLNYLRVTANDQLQDMMDQVMADDAPWLVELVSSREQQRFRLSSYRDAEGRMATRPMDDMEPLLPREEIAANAAVSDDG